MTSSGTCVPPGQSKKASGWRSAEKRARTDSTSNVTVDILGDVTTIDPWRLRRKSGSTAGPGQAWARRGLPRSRGRPALSSQAPWINRSNVSEDVDRHIRRRIRACAFLRAAPATRLLRRPGRHAGSRRGHRGGLALLPGIERERQRALRDEPEDGGARRTGAPDGGRLPPL